MQLLSRVTVLTPTDFQAVFPKWRKHFTFPPATRGGFSFPTSSPFVLSRERTHPGGCKMASHCARQASPSWPGGGPAPCSQAPVPFFMVSASGAAAAPRGRLPCHHVPVSLLFPSDHTTGGRTVSYAQYFVQGGGVQWGQVPAIPLSCFGPFPAVQVSASLHLAPPAPRPTSCCAEGDRQESGRLHGRAARCTATADAL